MWRINSIENGLLITDFHNLYKKNGLSANIIQQFQKIIYSYYKHHKREFPFRSNISPYNVLVSEIMLQQTQTGAVSEKFQNFIKHFPDFKTLAEAPLEKVLKQWHGLGYNRRALALKKIAETVVNDYNTTLPQNIEILNTFPQIGLNTAASIYVFSFNKPAIFIETNIRRVYLYFFFSNRKNIRDNEILPIIEKSIDYANPREWYYALMDYGVMLKKTHPELNKRSAHYRKQTPFKGSNRELRGEILKLLINRKSMDETKLPNHFKYRSEKINNVLEQLEKEGFIKRKGSLIFIAK